MEKTNTALIVIDIQMYMFSPENPVYQGELLLEKIGSLQEKAHRAEVPIIYVQQGRPRKGHPLEMGSPGWQLHPILVPGPQDIIIQKQMPSTFYQTTLDEYLSTHRIKKLVIAGIQTELCVDTTCREASDKDYDVTLVKDAHSTWTREELAAPQIIAHHNSLLGDWFVTVEEELQIVF
ncbi:cysteine hydrolase family protein [Ktedonospora formicarum]|uniref:Isochorismatase n=1 Tax=Ktedonospora formicarum TaxID=2778364 RepID=A0A8J3IAX4_9CHLR|nr:cysteine hydrolase family protein [Ktedonospora formicarum]GHO49282.1 isochorismatase [Ktedonospora formicarum]